MPCEAADAVLEKTFSRLFEATSLSLSADSQEFN